MLFLIILIIKIILLSSINHALNSAHINVHYNGIFSNKLSSGYLTVPRKVNKLGEHIAYSLNHYHTHNSFDEYTGNIENHTVNYHIDLGNELLHLELKPSTSFIAPLMIIERHKRDARERKVRPHKHTQCHYQGKIRNHENSKVAVSACNGLTGYIRTNEAEFLIEPSKNHKINKNGYHKHVVFHRTAINNNNNDDEIKISPKKHKKKRKRRHHSNCGTKEPKRLSETKIEWQPQGKVIVQAQRKIRNKNKNHIQSVQRKKNRYVRSIITPRYVEALVVADPSMIQFHEDGDVDVETYLLTIMNMVSALYKDASIGNFIRIVVVKIMLLEEEDSYQHLNISRVAQTTLESFCGWQHTFNPENDDDPQHHDVAILITRKDICSNSGCSTLGIANVFGMCRPDKSCSVNEDNGIALAHTITHELGHNFGMYHDTVKTGCDKRNGSVVHIMTPSFEADTIEVAWSNCSRRDINSFLDKGLGNCLEDEPANTEYKFEDDLPAGAIFFSDLQCRLQFNTTDEDTKMCSQLDEICSQLWCSINGTCTTLLRPAASGTMCGKHQWCQNQKCVTVEELPKKVNGGWGNWTDYGLCSRTCGSGISISLRECDHPRPSFGGDFCIGERVRYKICNIEPCPEYEPSFRAQQCSMKNNISIKGKYFTWLPYWVTNEPCKLYCTDSQDTLIQEFESVLDGTPCKIGSNDMCISGICKRVGCDWLVYSNTTEDRCGVCGGNSETCITIKGEFLDKVNTSEGYYEIVMIPSGSRHINIEEIEPSKNYIGIGKSESKDFYLNGDRMISMPGEYNIAGSLGIYERDLEMERIRIPGPIKHDISLYIVLKGKYKNLGIKYEYTLPSNITDESVYHWKLSDFTPCSKTCGSGIQSRHAICYKRHEGKVKDEFCWSNAQNSKPEEVSRSCNEEPCPAYWYSFPFQPCPITCKKIGSTEIPMKKRTILCVDQNEIALAPDQCKKHPRPHDIEPCNVILPVCSQDDNQTELTINDDYNNEINNNEFFD